MAELRARRTEADVAVVGAGPAGIAAACTAAESGQRVVLLDEAPYPGGQIWRHSSRTQLPGLARRWLDRLDRSGAEVVSGATVLGASPGFELAVQCRGEPRVVHAGQLVLATGARERFLPFPGWTLPNVFGVGGAQALLKSGASFAGRRVIIAGSGPLLLPVAAALASAGARVALVAEQAPTGRVLSFGAGLWRAPGKLLQAARYRAAFPRARYRTGVWATRATGDDRVREVTLTDGRRLWTEGCDALCVGYGLEPATELATLLGCTLEGGGVVVDEWQRTSVERVFCAGEPTGIAGVDSSLAEGQVAGYAAHRPQQASALFARRDRARMFAHRLRVAFALRDELRGLPDAATLVCRCEDVAYGRLRPEWSARQAKLYTRAGMGPCQGRVCGPALQFFFGWQPDVVRSPVANATVGTILHTTPSTHA